MRRYNDDGDLRPVMLDGGARRLIEELMVARRKAADFVPTEEGAIERIRAALRVSRRSGGVARVASARARSAPRRC